MSRKKILFINVDFGSGGAERIMGYIINGLSMLDKYEIKLLIMRDDRVHFLRDIPKNVEVESLHVTGRTKTNMHKLVRAIIREKADLCFTSVFRLNIMLALMLPIIRLFSGKKMKTISREANVLTEILKSYGLNNTFVRFLYKHFYNSYDRIIAQSNDMRNDMVSNWSIDPNKIVLINNPVRADLIRKKSSEKPSVIFPKDKLNYIAVGRIAEQKGFDLVIRRMAEMGDKLNFRLYIAGDKIENETIKIETLIADYGLANSVYLLGRQENPFALIAESDGLVLPSRHEGFPNVLLEAGALGKPVFANHCPGGIDEIVIPGINGYYCDFENQTEFEATLAKYQSTKFDASAIEKSIEDRYGFNYIMDKYYKLFNEVLYY